MTIELITGKALSPHVDSADDGAYHARTMGAGTYVLHGCACTMADANTAHIAPGELLVEGRHVRIMGTGEDVTVENGTQGQKRHDLLVVRYELGEEDVETAVLAVVKGVPTSTGEPNDPSCATGSILAGDPLAEHPLYRVPLDGVSVGTPVPLCEPWEPLSQALSRRDEAYPLPVPESATVPSDGSMFLMPPADGKGLVKRSAANVWTWIASKVRSTFGFGSTNVLGVSNGGTGAYDERGAANVLKLQSIARGVAIPASADLDTYKTPGNYVSSGADVSKTLQHTPVTANGFRMTVWHTLGANAGGSVVGQEVLVWTSGKRYWRSWIAASGWSAWSVSPTVPVAAGATATQEASAWREALGINADTLGLQSIRYGTEIASKTDLNNLTGPGNYVSKSATVSASLANCPVTTSGFRLTVWRTLGTTNAANGAVLGQELIVWVTGRRYWRSWTSDKGWDLWQVQHTYPNGKDAWGYNATDDVAYFGLNSKVVVGAAEKSASLKGALTLGSAGKPVSLAGNLNGKLSALGTNGASGTMFKRLWTGTLSIGGTVTVPGLSNYSVIMCTPFNEGTAMIGSRHVSGGSIIRCQGAFDSGDATVHGSVQSMQASFTVEGEKLTLVGASSFFLYDGHSVAKSVGQIWGLI